VTGGLFIGRKEMRLALGEPLNLARVPDDQLVMAYRNGDVRAFDELFARHYAGVRRFAGMMAGDEAAAEEIAQETFLAMTRSVERYQCQGHFRTWLMRIVRNLCLNWIEASRVRQRLRDGRDVDRLEVPSGDGGPLRTLECREDVERMTRAFSRLPERQREALLLHAIQEMSYQQVAEVLEIPINTVKTLIHRARANLSEAMADEGKE
jgi:RNA polymerase sigma-70 factor (ECF subfamily)